MCQKTIILDANILIRAVLGTKVAHLLSLYRNIGFFSPTDSDRSLAPKTIGIN